LKRCWEREVSSPVRNVLHEWTDDEPYREWEDELGRHWMYRCKNCAMNVE